MLQLMKGGRALICGQLTRDPEFLEVGSNNRPIGRFTVTAERGNQNEGRDGVFCRCTAWGDLREALRGCKKGDAVLVLAAAKETVKDGKTYIDYTAEFVTPAIKAASGSVGAFPGVFPPGTEEVQGDDDLPF